jgi:hypothetical protein
MELRVWLADHQRREQQGNNCSVTVLVEEVIDAGRGDDCSRMRWTGGTWLGGS